MRKWKVYLDTSVISYLEQEDAPERMAATRELWEMFRRGEYDVYLSTVTLGEIEDCPEPKRSKLQKHLEEIDYTVLEVTDEIRSLAQKIVDIGILTQKSLDDCQHIAAAMVGECDYIISWNFKHIVNIKTIRGVRAISNLEGYRSVDIIDPRMILGKEE